MGQESQRQPKRDARFDDPERFVNQAPPQPQLRQTTLAITPEKRKSMTDETRVRWVPYSTENNAKLFAKEQRKFFDFNACIRLGDCCVEELFMRFSPCLTGFGLWLSLMLHLLCHLFSLGKIRCVLALLLEFHVLVQTASVKKVRGELESREMQR